MTVIDDDLVRHRLLGSGDVLSRFPFLNNYRTKIQELDKRCTTCAGGAQAKADRLDLFNEIRQVLSTLTQPQWSELKQLLGLPDSTSILVSYRTKLAGKSQIESRTF